MGRVSDAKEKLMGAVAELIWTGSYGSTTVDDICAKAGVKKGSFYYFFDSKAALAAAAIDAEWSRIRPRYEAMFSTTIPPLQRLETYCQHLFARQKELKLKFGYVLGCPWCSLGSEVSTQEQGLRKKIEDVMDEILMFLETSIRDAHSAKLIEAPDPGAKARMLYAYYEGILTQARIRNDLSLLREAGKVTRQALGVKNLELAAA